MKFIFYIFIINIFLCTTTYAVDNIIYINNLNYRDIISKYEQIDKYESGIKRMEFEKKDEYKKRIESISKDAIENFSIELPSYDHYLKYNIDKEIYVFNGFSVCDRELKIIVYEQEATKHLYRKINRYGVVINDIKRNNIDNFYFTFSFKLNPDIAKKYKDKMKIVAEFAPTKKNKSYILYNTFWSEPTYSNEEKKNIITRLINVKLKKLYIVGKYDNEILSSILF